jgi:hypothetical protein
MLSIELGVIWPTTITHIFDCNLHSQGDRLIVLKGFSLHYRFEFIKLLV